MSPGECFTKTKINFKLDLTMAGHSCHCFLSPFTDIGLSRLVQIMVTNLQNFKFCYNSFLKEKILSKDHNGDSNQWHEWPAIFKSNIKLILVFVKRGPDLKISLQSEPLTLPILGFPTPALNSASFCENASR